jgi:hypothetical protein
MAGSVVRKSGQKARHCDLALIHDPPRRPPGGGATQVVEERVMPRHPVGENIDPGGRSKADAFHTPQSRVNSRIGASEEGGLPGRHALSLLKY